jgi:hypothetical protein
MTATKSAKYRHAWAERPSGTGAIAITAPIARGSSVFGHAPAGDLIDSGES